ncbi:MAG: tryptophan-rich sensory protein [Oscillospiraceae bacterium]|nr:tryptophan-rich sensory protein [Oscillospiraceae bacterium]
MVKAKPAIVNLVIALGVGGLSAWLTRDAMAVYGTLRQPPLSPPGWVFPVVWTVLFVLMALAASMVWTAAAPGRDGALTLYGVRLLFNFLWTLLFFSAQKYGFALLWLVVLWVLILLTAVQFYRQTRPAGYLMLPYLLWVTFAGYLNAGVWLLNR